MEKPATEKKPIKLQYIPVKLQNYMELLTADVSGTMEYRNIIFCGDRNYTNFRFVLEVMETIKDYFHGINVVEGEAKGADSICKFAAQLLNSSGIGHWTIDPHEYKRELGKRGGPARNAEMLKTQPFMVIAFHDFFEQSAGTMDMVLRSLKAKVPVLLIKNESGLRAYEVRLVD